MLHQNALWIAQGQNPCYLLLNQANRHGIVTGASVFTVGLAISFLHLLHAPLCDPFAGAGYMLLTAGLGTMAWAVEQNYLAIAVAMVIVLAGLSVFYVRRMLKEVQV